jgi:alpha-L-fucosidase
MMNSRERVLAAPAMNAPAKWLAACAVAAGMAMCMAIPAGAEAPAQPAAAPPAAAPEPEYLKAKPEDMQWWREARFGMFIHWGSVSLKGTEIGWSRGGKRGNRKDGKTGEIPVEIYDNLYREFNPTKFNAREWVEIAKSAGMKYMVFTSRHHDGFSMFDTRQSDYKITNSPFKRDVCAELAKACHEGGLRLGWYHSPPNWYHPDFMTENHAARFIPFLHGQVRELLSNYGQVDVMWFDGLGGKATDWDSDNLFKLIRSLQPHIIINNRCGLPGDFDTPEQRIGTFRIDRPWETCMTICRQWAWKPDDQMKTLKQCLQTLITCAGGDGNLLFNVGPMPTGEIEPRQVERLKEMGQWLAKYGQTIYGTRGGPWRPGAWGAATCSGNTAYLHIFQWSGDSVTLPAIGRKIISSKALTGGKADVKQTDAGVEISVPAADRQEIDTVIQLELDGPAFNPSPPSVALSGSLSSGKKARASNVFRNNPSLGPDKALDDDSATRWATDGGIHEAWLEVDLGAPTAIGRVMIDEPEEYKRVQAFELQFKDGDAWKTFHKGTAIGPRWTAKFEPVTARYVRLNILKAADGPTIWEFQLFAPGK